jgi:hypothetical protein
MFMKLGKITLNLKKERKITLVTNDLDLSTFIKHCVPIVANRKVFPRAGSPDRKILEKQICETITSLGWPADLAEVLDLQKSAEDTLKNEIMPGSPTFVALVGIELACNERILSQVIRSHSDCIAKLIWLRLELMAAAGQGEWIKALNDAITWCSSSANCLRNDCGVVPTTRRKARVKCE